MDENKKVNMIFYQSWFELINKYVPRSMERLDLIESILTYGLTGEKMEIENPMLKMFQEQVFDQIDVNKDKYRKCVEAGRLGGKAGKGVSRNVGNKNASKNKSESKANNSESIPNVNVNENVNENENNPSTLSPLKGKRGKVLTDEEYAEEFGLDPSECLRMWREQQNENTETDI